MTLSVAVAVWNRLWALIFRPESKAVSPEMRIKFIILVFLLVLPLRFVHAQGTVPTFQYIVDQDSYTLVGRDPARGGVTTLPTVLVPITLSFDAKQAAGKPFLMDAAPDVPRVLRSPVFSKFAFPSGGSTQYATLCCALPSPRMAGGIRCSASQR